MAEVDEREKTPEEIKAEILAARARSAAAPNALPRTAKQRREAENKQRKGRVNASLLRGQGIGRDETWTIRAKAEHIKAVKGLAEHLSEPRAKVSIAALMDEAIELLLAKYRGERGDA